MNIKENIIAASIGKTTLFSVGGAGFIIKTADGKLIGIDLYLSECVERVEQNSAFKRLLPHVLETGDVQFDYLIATHFHRDHLDIDSIPDLMKNGQTRLFAAYDCAEDLRKLGIAEEQITYVKPGSRAECGSIVFEFTPCDHGTLAPLAVGVIVNADGKRIYETGDTCLRLDLLPSLGMNSIDVLIGPINGAYGNMDSADFAALAEALCPGFSIPCHYGMFTAHGGDPNQFCEIMNEKGLPYRLLPIGSQTIVE